MNLDLFTLQKLLYEYHLYNKQNHIIFPISLKGSLKNVAILKKAISSKI